jgi:hypothetical protein
MQSPEVMAWHYAVTEEEPLGVFRNRWGDAIVRFATMAIFAAPEEIEGMKRPVGYSHGPGCPGITLSHANGAGDK